ncbi:MAG: hypothetical protein WBG13_24910, partial [Pseudolabrys sp.]
LRTGHRTNLHLYSGRGQVEVMSALGQKQTFAVQTIMSALPQIAGISAKLTIFVQCSLEVPS